MGKIKQGILGGVSGTVGTVIGSSWKGIDYIRAKATSYHDAQSDAQLAVRGTFKKIIALSKALINTVIKPIWNKKAVKNCGYNLFVKTNFQFIDPVSPLELNESITISIGDLPSPRALDIVDDPAVPGGIIVTWEDNSGKFGAEATDLLRLVAISNDEVVNIDFEGATRDAESASVTLPFGSGVQVRVFAFFENSDQTSYSNDQDILLTVS